MDTTHTTSSDTAILTRVIAPANGTLLRSAAEAFLALSFPREDIDRMNELAEKNRQGLANDAELAELEGYSRIGGSVNLLQVKARRSLGDG